MSDKEPVPKSAPSAQPYLSKDGNLEAHMIIDMLRIETITAELKEFKETNTERLDRMEARLVLKMNRIENWLVGMVATSFSALIMILISMLTGGGA